ncbi:hypothetical protein CWT12_02820 [Actinomyces sp. 432]|uniref:hypothetical protein n=1 Tax=Actinomyces sp. 432 TaxID=2057798 RepID=UPI00137387B1|nr:hypothetical protein [Actinomyces sp. 432]QHO90480.1 hypothetical protein CWT12_02820 [Actinomyces sp. 432]
MSIIMGERDELVPRESAEDFCRRFVAGLTVVPGTHWLHAPGEVDAVAQWERLRLQQGARARSQALPAE